MRQHTRYAYLRDPKTNAPIVTIALVSCGDDDVLVGLAVLGEGDHPNKALGRTIAEGRAVLRGALIADDDVSNALDTLRATWLAYHTASRRSVSFWLWNTLRLMGHAYASTSV